MSYWREKNKDIDNQRLKIVNGIFDKFDGNVCIVEGKHDVGTLRDAMEKLDKDFKITTCVQIKNNGYSLKNFGRIFVMTDKDHGGEAKKRMVLARLEDMGLDERVDLDTGKRLLKVLGVVCVEQIGRPLENLLRE